MTVIQHDADIVEFGPQPPVATVGQTAGDEMEGARASPLRRRRSAFPLHGLWAALPACPPPAPALAVTLRTCAEQRILIHRDSHSSVVSKRAQSDDLQRHTFRVHPKTSTI